MSIVCRINWARQQFHIRRGLPAEVLYLGWRDRDELSETIAPFMCYSAKTGVEITRAEYDGLSIYVVDAEHHVAVSLKDDA